MVNKLPPLDATLIEILGRPSFKCISVAGTLRVGGRIIERRAEAEQAAVIHFMLGHYLAAPEQWMENAGGELLRMAGSFYDAENNVKLLDLYASENGWKFARVVTQYTGKLETRNTSIHGVVIFHESKGVASGQFYKEKSSAKQDFEQCRRLTEVPDKQPCGFAGSHLQQFKAEYYDNGGVA